MGFLLLQVHSLQLLLGMLWLLLLLDAIQTRERVWQAAEAVG
jgi:hypothetical protein